MKRKRDKGEMVWLVLVLLFGLFSSIPGAKAAGFLIPGVGSRAISRGGAFVATGDDLTTLWHNPANLARIKGLSLMYDNALVFNPYTFQRHPTEGQKKPFPKMENVAPPYYIPFLGLSFDFGLIGLPKPHRLVFAAGAWGPYEGKYWWDKGPGEDGKSAQPQCEGPEKDKFLCTPYGPQRYTQIKSEIVQIYIAFSLAYSVELGPVTLNIGGGFHLVQTETFQRMAVQIALGKPLPSTNDSMDAIIDIDVMESFRPSWNAGLTLDLPLGFSLGASFKPPMEVNAGGTLKIDLPEIVKSIIKIKGEKARLTLNLPWFLRVGLRYQPTFFPRLDLEVAFVYEAWSSIDKITLTPEDIKDPLNEKKLLAPIEIDRGWQDSWSVRAGAQFAIIPKHLFVRLGWFYESGAIPLERTNVTEAHTERHGLGVGLEGRFALGPVHFALTLAYSHSFHPRLDVQNSKEVMTAIPQPDPEKHPPEVVGNGIYESSFEIFALSLTIQWPGP